MSTISSLSVEIVTTGTEILLGDIVDTNAAWIAQQLREIGVNLYYKTTVGDNEGRVRGVLEMVLARSDVAVVTGGLGPTVDDITRDAIANATGCPLVRDESIIEALRQRFQRWGSTMSENNARQGYLPEGCTVVENRNVDDLAACDVDQHRARLHRPGSAARTERLRHRPARRAPRDETDDDRYGDPLFDAITGRASGDSAADSAHHRHRRERH